MKKFLELVANDLYTKFGNNLSRTVVVFPNKRAGLFFKEYLAKNSDAPVWAPYFASISDLFQEWSSHKLADPILLICELYKVFKQYTDTDETLDDFYYWGQLLISDFDDVDKNMVDAGVLFQNLSDLKNMEDYDFIDEEQEEALKMFFENFSIEQQTELKQKFMKLWERLGTIYSNYKKLLHEKGIAYEGMLYREVIEELTDDDLKADRYVFVGFNVLNKVEIQLFELLQKKGKALFYWDYDHFYTDEPRRQKLSYQHEAGEFILRNLKLFPNELPSEAFHSMREPKEVKYISSPTENAQVRYLSNWVNEMTQGEKAAEDEKENAIVLCNEALLLPIIYGIPSSVKNINITMGFPLSQTPIYSLLTLLLDLQLNGFSKDTGRYRYEFVSPILKHPYVRKLSEKALVIEQQLADENRFFPTSADLHQDKLLQLIFGIQVQPAALYSYLIDVVEYVSRIYRTENDSFAAADHLYKESLFKSYTLLNRLMSMLNEGNLDGLEFYTHTHLIRSILSGTSIPFHGEPIIGMQVMGVLETRNLDFKNLLMLSVNEGKLPQSGSEVSFIPYNLRKAFGMTTIEHKNAVYAYYFYRLIQRAENVTLMYNTSSDGLNRGEMSRFMLQYLVESPHPVQKGFVSSSQSPMVANEIKIEKSAPLMEALCSKFNARRSSKSILSPSALNTYLDCPLKFYFRSVAHIKPLEEVNGDIDNALFGTIFHKTAENIYNDMKSRYGLITKEAIEGVLKNDVMLKRYVDNAFNSEFFKNNDGKAPEYNGTQLINSEVILSYIKQLLQLDIRSTPFTIVANEQPVYGEMEISTSSGPLTVRIGGTIDRMDRTDSSLRIVDYKTGGKPNHPNSIEQLFIPDKKRPNYAFQAFLYSSLIRQEKDENIQPALLYIHQAADEDYSPIIKLAKENITNFTDEMSNEFRERLRTLLEEEIFNQRVPFTQTEDTDRCSYCDFKNICQR